MSRPDPPIQPVAGRRTTLVVLAVLLALWAALAFWVLRHGERLIDASPDTAPGTPGATSATGGPGPGERPAGGRASERGEADPPSEGAESSAANGVGSIGGADVPREPPATPRDTAFDAAVPAAAAPAADGPTADGPAEDGPAEDGPAEDGPAEDGSAEDGSAGDDPAEDDPVGDGPVGDGSAGDDPIGDGPAGDGSAGDGPADAASADARASDTAASPGDGPDAAPRDTGPSAGTAPTDTAAGAEPATPADEPPPADGVVGDGDDAGTGEGAAESVFEVRRREEIATLSTLLGELRFERLGSVPLTSSRESLERAFEILFLYPGTRLRLIVESRETNDAAFDRRLALERGRAVVDHLVSRGIERERLSFDAGDGGGLPFGEHRVRVLVEDETG